MKSLFQKKRFFILVILTLFACEEWNLDEEDFISVELSNLEIISLGSVRLTGEIKGLRVGQVSDHGFVWASNSKTPTIHDNEGIESLGIKDTEDLTTFSSELNKLVPSTQYNFVAFAVLDDLVFYSEVLTWNSNSGMVFTDSIHYAGGKNFDLYGHISGTTTGLIAIQHGFCWSTQNETPSLEDNFEDLGNQRSDLPFSIKIDSLELGVSIYLSAFGILRHPTTFILDTVYGEVLSFNGDLYDIWIPRASVPDLLMGFNDGPQGFSNLDNALLYISGYEESNFWEYNSQTDSWTQKEDFGGVVRSSQTGFSVNGKVYMGTGRSTTFQPLADFWEYDPQTDAWTQKAFFPGDARSDAVGFSIDGKGYVGLGAAGGTNKNDFWEYGPEQNSWTQKADFGGDARNRAVAFSVGGKAYVGTGISASFPSFTVYNDFWEYDPQGDSWTQLSDFEGDGRYLATGFSIEDKGYMGLGYNPAIGDFTDFWEYNPQKDSWKQLTDIPASDASRFSGFSTEGRAFVGRFNFWEYVTR
ncbi:MAG: hypothetical protein AB8F74_10835 [Saprospiraceae bacterium]